MSLFEHCVLESGKLYQKIPWTSLKDFPMIVLGAKRENNFRYEEASTGANDSEDPE